MPDKIVEEQHYQNQDFTQQLLPVAEYDNCTFTNCVFSDADLTNCSFLECQFEQCNLSNAVLAKTAFKNVVFKHCKMMGLQFPDCNDFLLEMSFEDCQLDFSSFYQLNLKKTTFKKCSIKDADFTETNLSEATLADCNLKGAMFNHTNLEKADLRTAINYTIDPENNSLKKARLSLKGLPGLLEKYQIKIEK